SLVHPPGFGFYCSVAQPVASEMFVEGEPDVDWRGAVAIKPYDSEAALARQIAAPLGEGVGNRRGNTALPWVATNTCSATTSAPPPATSLCWGRRVSDPAVWPNEFAGQCRMFRLGESRNLGTQVI